MISQGLSRMIIQIVSSGRRGRHWFSMLAACLARWSAKARPTFVSLRIIDAIAPAVCFLGKVEKAFSGVAASGQTDSGVSARLYGTFLSWINDHETDVFVVATVRIRIVGQRRSTAGAGDAAMPVRV